MEAEYEQYVLSLGKIEEVITPFIKDDDITAWREGDESECDASRKVAIAVAAAYGVRVEFGDVQAVVAQLMGVSIYEVQGVHGFYSPEPEGIMIDDRLGPEAGTFVLWHEIGHLMLGHHLEGAMPETDIGDLLNPMHGVRSFEYMADAFAMTMLQRTGVKENRFARMSSFKTMLRFEKYYEEVMNVDWDESKSYDGLINLMANLDVVGATMRKQEFLRANWPLLINKANEVRGAMTGEVEAVRKACPAVIPPSQVSTKEMREAVENQRFRNAHKATLQAAVSEEPLSEETCDKIEEERAAWAKREERRAKGEEMAANRSGGGVGRNKLGLAAGGQQQGARGRGQSAGGASTPGSGSQPTPMAAPLATLAGPLSQAERIKAIEEAASALGGKLPGAFGKRPVSESQIGRGQEKEGQGAETGGLEGVVERAMQLGDEQEVKDLMAELGF